MLKLSQINLLENSLLVKGFEPVVSTHVNDIVKSDDTIQREKDNATFIVAEIVKVGVAISPETVGVAPIKFNVGQMVLIHRNAGTPITFPIEGYKEKELALIGMYAVVALVETDNAPPLMESL